MGKSWRQDSKNVNWCRAKQQKFHKKQKHGKSLIFSSNKSFDHNIVNINSNDY